MEKREKLKKNMSETTGELELETKKIGFFEKITKELREKYKEKLSRLKHNGSPEEKKFWENFYKESVSLFWKKSQELIESLKEEKIISANHQDLDSLKEVIGELSATYSDFEKSVFFEYDSHLKEIGNLVEQYSRLLTAFLPEKEKKESEKNFQVFPLTLENINRLPKGWRGICGNKLPPSCGPNLIYERQGKFFAHRCYFGTFPIEEQTAKDIYRKCQWESDDILVFVNPDEPPWEKMNNWTIFMLGLRQKKYI